MPFLDKLRYTLCENQQLSADLWENRKLNPQIASRLLKIANDFSKLYGIDPDAIVDIVLIGSMASFNWTDLSDIDVHLIVDFAKIDDNLELLADYFKLAKSDWNDAHQITICNHEVEIYVQDVNDPYYSAGAYSLLTKEWLSTPSPNLNRTPDKLVKDKAATIIDRISAIKNMYNDGKNVSRQIASLRNRIKKLRSIGLQRSGEYSIENLVFKYLRNNGHLERLSQLNKLAYDERLSLEC